MRGLRKREDGQSALEFALILPILLIVVCGIIDFGWLLFNQLAVSNTARESARFAVVNASTTTGPALITAKANAVAPDTIKQNMTVTVTFSDTNTPVRGYVTVKITTRIKV
ncbi:MAG TPA: pilus assembly protein, partial [Clostridiales bacterium]|nr:pilus assembly protein [Clostridiales bacterium]